jgi:outer membrane protein OmpA-like peptidoglycan-associated protein
VTGRRVALGAAVLVAVLSAPAAAQEDADRSVEDILIEESIEDILLDDSVESLQTERVRGGNVELSISSDVLFEFDRANLTPVARQTVERIAERIGSGSGPVLVEGHTDALGSDAYNLRLSLRRAETVTAALGDLLPAGRTLRARGYGESRPVEPNTVGGDDNPRGRAKNRRVTITFERG